MVQVLGPAAAALPGLAGARRLAPGLPARGAPAAAVRDKAYGSRRPIPLRLGHCSRPRAPRRCAGSRAAAYGANEGADAGQQETEGLYPFDERDYHRVEFMPEPYGPLLYSRDNPARGPKAVVVLRRRWPSPEEAAAAAADAEAAAAELAAASARRQQRRQQNSDPRAGVPFFDPPDVDPPPGAGDEREEARRRVRWQPAPPPPPTTDSGAALPPPPPPLSPRPSAAHDFGLEYPDQAASFLQQQHQHQQQPTPPHAAAAAAAAASADGDDDDDGDGSAGGALAEKEDQLALEVFISGDSAVQLYCLVNGAPSERPMALDLLWQLWRRAAAADGPAAAAADDTAFAAAAAAAAADGGSRKSPAAQARDGITPSPSPPSPSSPSTPAARWSLVRAAIVELRAEVYIARLFFGDAATGKVVWDADCRPSDACYMVLRTGAPLFVSRGVWRACAQRLRETEAFASIEHVRRVEEAQRAESEGRAAAGRPGAASSAAAAMSPAAAAAAAAAAAEAAAGPDPDLLPAVQLLRRELDKAVADEDYAAAAALRDHPLMRLADDARFYRAIGYGDAARALYARLAEATDGGERLVGAAAAEALLARGAGGSASFSAAASWASASEEEEEEGGEGGKGGGREQRQQQQRQQREQRRRQQREE